MPELPEVESFKKYLDKTSLHQTIEDVSLASPGMLLNTSRKKLSAMLKGNSFEKSQRHGKFLFIQLQSKGFLMIHFGMTGFFQYGNHDKKSIKPYALLVQFSNGNNLIFSDVRKLGKIAIVENVDSFVEKRGYGKDALKIDEGEFMQLFEKRKAPIKAALMNQKILAGVGNEYSDEILFQSRIHPASITSKLSKKQLKEIFHHMHTVLKEAVKQNADHDKLKQYFFLDNRKAGLPCPGNCKGKTEFQTIGGRSSYFCPSCQKLYK